MNGAQALFKALTDAGLDTCFANPGTSEMQLVYEMGRTGNVRPVLCLQENTVTGAADGYARMAGKPAFTLLHVGSGLAKGLANLHNAGRANTTMVNIVGANATYHQPNFAEHEFIGGNIVDVARVVSHWAHQAKNASDLAVRFTRWCGGGCGDPTGRGALGRGKNGSRHHGGASKTPPGAGCTGAVGKCRSSVA